MIRAYLARGSGKIWERVSQLAIIPMPSVTCEPMARWPPTIQSLPALPLGIPAPVEESVPVSQYSHLGLKLPHFSDPHHTEMCYATLRHIWGQSNIHLVEDGPRGGMRSTALRFMIDCRPSAKGGRGKTCPAGNYHRWQGGFIAADDELV